MKLFQRHVCRTDRRTDSFCGYMHLHCDELLLAVSAIILPRSDHTYGEIHFLLNLTVRETKRMQYFTST